TVPKLGISRGIPLPRRHKLLIENTRLRSKLTSKHSSQLQISNRERMAIRGRNFSLFPSFKPQAFSSKTLIANLELEFEITGCGTNHMQISNRKFSAIFHCRFPSPGRLSSFATRLPRADSVPAKALITALPWPPCCGPLIETTRLEFPVTPTNTAQYKILIGTKTAFWRSVFHRTPLLFRPPASLANTRRLPR